MQGLLDHHLVQLGGVLAPMRPCVCAPPRLSTAINCVYSSEVQIGDVWPFIPGPSRVVPCLGLCGAAPAVKHQPGQRIWRRGTGERSRAPLNLASVRSVLHRAAGQVVHSLGLGRRVLHCLVPGVRPPESRALFWPSRLAYPVLLAGKPGHWHIVDLSIGYRARRHQRRSCPAPGLRLRWGRSIIDSRVSGELLGSAQQEHGGAPGIRCA